MTPDSPASSRRGLGWIVTPGRLCRRALDWLSVPRDLAACQLLAFVPTNWPLFLALLPYAGCWAYRYDPWVIECRKHWIATGKQHPEIQETQGG